MDEILVHISAPTTRKNDDTYRSLADAYLNFEPAVVAGSTSNVEELRKRDEVEHEIVNPTFSETSVMTTSKESYGSFPSHVSSVDSVQAERSFVSGYSFQSMEVSPIDSGRLAQLERLQANWKRQRHRPLRSTDANELPPSSRVSLTASGHIPLFLEDTQLAAGAIQSQLPDNFSATEEDTSEDESSQQLQIEAGLSNRSLLASPDKARSQHRKAEASSEVVSNQQIFITAGGVDSGELLLKDVNMANNSPHHSTFPNIEWSAEAADDSFWPATGIVQSTMEPGVGPLSRTTLSSRQAAISSNDNIVNANRAVVSKALNSNQLPFEVLPPAPNVSTENPGTLPSQMTKYLHGIKQQNPGRFKPSRTLRALDTDERGYWLVETASWSTKIQFEFWSSLCQRITNGNFGWGVYLCREPQYDDQTGRASAHELGQVRIYCWGEMVESIWLALWLYSDGKISGSGARWFDAGDVAVIQVR